MVGGCAPSVMSYVGSKAMYIPLSILALVLVVFFWDVIWALVGGLALWIGTGLLLVLGSPLFLYRWACRRLQSGAS